MQRAILHLDCDCFYASVEELHHPELRGKAMAVGGSTEARHGIILAKTQAAKIMGVKTAEPLWKARQKCPNLIIIPPDFKKYVRFSQMVREICLRYTDKVEPFGLDESWLDITGCERLFGSPFEIAKKIQQAVLHEIGITVSIGVSYNKIFAKLGSDYKKPFGITNISQENYKDIVWNLAVSDLLMVGKATTEKLKSKGIQTIGQLALAPPELLRRWLGKNGDMLYTYANGLDNSPVSDYDARRVIKSIGNSTTPPRDIEDNREVKKILYVLAESVAMRMRSSGFKGRVVSVSMRDTNLVSFTRQKRLDRYTNLSDEILKQAFELFLANYRWDQPIRSLGVAVADLEFGNMAEQTDFFFNNEKRERSEKLEKTVDGLKERFGKHSIKRACLLSDKDITEFNPHDDNMFK